MTIFETAILASLIGVLLFLAAGGVRAVRQQARRNLCQRMMISLSESLALYHRETKSWPPGGADASAGRAIAAMLAVPAVAQRLQSLPPSLGLGRDPQLGILDPWNHPVHYLTADARNETDRRHVAAHGGAPIFESAGRDGNFGRNDPAAAADNLRTSDL